MNNTNYSDYTDIYKGTIIPENSFGSFIRKASSKVDYYTFNKIKEKNEKIVYATCEIAELLYNQDKLIANQDNDKSSIASETVGPHSINYINKSTLQAQRILSNEELEKECYSICLRYLSSTGLMYRGNKSVSTHDNNI